MLNTCDGLNRLVGTERSSGGETAKASYTYNAAGIRMAKTVNGITTAPRWTA